MDPTVSSQNPPLAVDVLAARIGAQLATETLCSHAEAFDLGRAWAQIGVDHDWTAAETQRVAMDCTLAGIHPDQLAAVIPMRLPSIDAAERGAAWRRLVDATGLPRLVDWLARWIRWKT